MSFRHAFAAFVLLAIFCAFPLCALGFNLASRTPMEASSHRSESGKDAEGLYGNPAQGTARTAHVPAGDQRRHTAGKPGATWAGLTPEKDPGFASESRTETVQPEVERVSIQAPPGSGARAVARSQGVRSVPHRETSDYLREPDAGHLLYEVTAYSHGCVLPLSGHEGPAHRAANGRWPVADLTVAADTALHPFGSELLIEGVGFRTVGDRGHAIKGRRLDLFVDSCSEARAFGRRWLAVIVVPPATTAEAAQ